MVVSQEKEEEFNIEDYIRERYRVIEKNWQSLIRPKTVEMIPSSQNPNSASIVLEPLEKGFGITLGNSLRRVLLSCLQGKGQQQCRST